MATILHFMAKIRQQINVINGRAQASVNSVSDRVESDALSLISNYIGRDRFRIKRGHINMC